MQNAFHIYDSVANENRWKQISIELPCVADEERMSSCSSEKLKTPVRAEIKEEKYVSLRTIIL